MKNIERCPECGGQGWYAVEGNNDRGEPEMALCYYCKGTGLMPKEEREQEADNG